MNRLLVLAVVVSVLFGASAVATAGDQSVRLGFDPESPDVESGGTVEVSVVATTDGGQADQGIADSTLRLEFPGEYLDVVALEAGPFLEADEARLETEARVNNTAGVVELDQELPGTREGVVGTGVLAFVTFEIADDTPASVAEIEMGDSDFRFAASDFPISSFGSGELVVDGGGETLSPTVPEDVEFDATGDRLTADDSGAEGGTGTDDQEGTDGNAGEGGADSEGDDGDESISGDETGPGFGLPAALLAVGVTAVLLIGRAR